MENEKEMQPTDIGSQTENSRENELNELLRSNTGLQSQFDRQVSKALATARSNWERERQEGAARQETREEQERRAVLEERERALALRERRASAAEALEKRGLPAGLAGLLPLEDDDSASRGLDTLERAFTEEVRRAVEQRLKGAAPSGGGQAAYASQLRAALGLK